MNLQYNLMSATVFFSWQSDRPEKEGRYFVEDAIKGAIKNLSQHIELQEAVREGITFDKDTKDEPGFVRIFQTILEKIEKATIFVPDFTFVAMRPKGQPTPNPNVLIEYGYALKAMGHKGEHRIMPVMNSAYGEPSRETMPFDLLEHRNPITYNLPEGASADTRRREMGELTKSFERAFKTFFASDYYKDSIPKPAPSQYRDPLERRARFRAKGQPIGVSRGPIDQMTGQTGTKMYLTEGPAMWLRVGPVTPVEPLMKVTDLEDSAAGIAVLPLTEASDFPSLVWSSDGCGYVRPFGSEPSPTVAYIFTDGEIWAISTLFLHYHPELILLEEKRFAISLEQSAQHLQRIGIVGTYRWVAGMEGIQDRYLPSQFGVSRGPGPCMVDSVEQQGTYNIGENAAQALEPFFAEVFDKCRARRPGSMLGKLRQ